MKPGQKGHLFLLPEAENEGEPKRRCVGKGSPWRGKGARATRVCDTGYLLVLKALKRSGKEEKSQHFLSRGGGSKVCKKGCKPFSSSTSTKQEEQGRDPRRWEERAQPREGRILEVFVSKAKK